MLLHACLGCSCCMRDGIKVTSVEVGVGLGQHWPYPLAFLRGTDELGNHYVLRTISICLKRQQMR